MIFKAVKYFEKGFHAQGFAFGDDWRCPRCKQPKEKFNRA